jgi:glycosyltransferase involved in cell wall biosynthesis
MVSITIPTLNSAKTLGMAIESIKVQVLGDELEIIVVDSGSVDDTVKIAARSGARVITDSGRLLGARRRGLDEAKGQCIVLLDSDQVLRPNSIRAACDLIANGCDMVALGERVYEPASITARLSDLDKQLLSHDVSSQLDPVSGVILPRVFRRQILENAFANIPRSLDGIVVAHDHAIIYFEAFKISKAVGYVPDAVWHVEPDRILSLWQKNFRYGWSTRQLLKTGCYGELVRHKTRLRTIQGRTDLRLRIASLAFLTLKAGAYIAGYVVGGRFRP